MPIARPHILNRAHKTNIQTMCRQDAQQTRQKMPKFVKYLAENNETYTLHPKKTRKIQSVLANTKLYFKKTAHLRTLLALLATCEAIWPLRCCEVGRF